MAELSNGPVVDQWGAPAPQPPTNGIHNGPATPTIYSGWGAPPISASVAPPPAQTFSQQPAFPSHWGSPPSTQPNITSWGAPPPPSSYPAAAAAPQQIQYSNHHFISPQPNPTPPTFTNPTPPHTFTTSYWGSPPGPTPPPSTPQERVYVLLTLWQLSKQISSLTLSGMGDFPDEDRVLHRLNG